MPTVYVATLTLLGASRPAAQPNSMWTELEVSDLEITIAVRHLRGMFACTE